jgi:hypothetical protein
MSEIYIRKPNIKSRYSKDNIETSDMLEQFLQQIEMTLSTPTTSVLGVPSYGVALSYYLWTFNTNEADLRNSIETQIARYCSLAGEFSYTIDIEYFKTDSGDTAVIDITVEDDNLVRIIVE